MYTLAHVSRFLRTTLVLPAILVAIASANPLAAQERKGFFVGVGLGWGSLDVTCDGCDVDREAGFSGNFRLGGALSDKVLLGAESEGWFKTIEGTSISFSTLTASVYFYPATRGLFLRGGLGLALLSATDADTETGVGYSFGAGYDIPVAKKTAITPFANWAFGNFDGGGVNNIQLGVGVSFY